MTGVLDGLRVLEMGHFVAAPAASAMLADWGADVIKIEPPDGDTFRGYKEALKAETGSEINWRFEVHNRNKKSISLDLSKPEGKKILYKLVESADVFITNYLSAAIKKLEMDYDTLSRINPGIIYALGTGYGTKGPDKDERGFDFTSGWARTGIQYLIGEPGGVPPQQRGGMMDRTMGSHMVGGILAALWHKEKTGEGQELELSLFHSGIWTIAPDYQVALAGQPLAQVDRKKRLNPLWNSYCAKDGRWFQLAMAQSELAWPGFCRALDRPDLEDDPRFDGMIPRGRNCGELIKLMDGIFSTRNRSDWEKRFKENDCIYGLVETHEDVINDPQVAANEIFTDVPHPDTGTAKFVTTPVKFRQNPSAINTNSPEAGQHTEEILLELGYDWDEISELKDLKAII